MDPSAKTSGDTNQGLMSKLKGSDGLGMSIGNCSVDNGDGTDHGPSQRFVQYQLMLGIIFSYLRTMLDCVIDRIFAITVIQLKILTNY